MESGRHRLPNPPTIRHTIIETIASPYQYPAPAIIQSQLHQQQVAAAGAHLQHQHQPAVYHHSYQIQPATQDHNFNVLEHLSEKERQIITDVLNRDESVRQRDAARLM